jgi:hypothetical protein
VASRREGARTGARLAAVRPEVEEGPLTGGPHASMRGREGRWGAAIDGPWWDELAGG